MTGKHKPSRGVCGVCGRAQVAPTFEQIARAFMMDRRPEQTTQGRVWVSGHQYDPVITGRTLLVRVRCIDHAERHDSRINPRTDRPWGA